MLTSQLADIAVIMSVYQNDRLEYLRQSVESILSQTYPCFDFFIVCDGPVSSAVLNYLNSVSDNRVRLFLLEKNTGLAGALNYLLEKVLKEPGYKLIARMDADDNSMPSRFEKQRRFMHENPAIACTGTWYEEIDDSGKHLSFRKLPLDHERLRKRYYMRTPFVHSSVMFTKELIRKAGYYPVDTCLMEDNVLWGRALKCGLRFANIPEYLLKFRIDKDFFKRRSGIKYGWHYILTRFKTIRYLGLPWYSYFLSIAAGCMKMMPPVFIARFYSICRKFATN